MKGTNQRRGSNQGYQKKYFIEHIAIYLLYLFTQVLLIFFIRFGGNANQPENGGLTDQLAQSQANHKLQDMLFSLQVYSSRVIDQLRIQ